MDVERSRSGVGTWQRRCSSRALRGGAAGSGRGEVERRRSSRKLSSSWGRKKKNSSEEEEEEEQQRGKEEAAGGAWEKERQGGESRGGSQTPHLVGRASVGWVGRQRSRGGGTDLAGGIDAAGWGELGSVLRTDHGRRSSPEIGRASCRERVFLVV